MSVGALCVHPGEKQAITVEGAPGSRLIYLAEYADGSSAFSPDYPGGNDQGQIGADGEFRDSWVVGDHASPGPVKVTAYDAYKIADPEANPSTTFRVAEIGKDCA